MDWHKPSLIALFAVATAGGWFCFASSLEKRPAAANRAAAKTKNTDDAQAYRPRASRQSARALAPLRDHPEDQLSGYQAEFVQPALAVLDELDRQAESNGDTRLITQVALERQQLVAAARGIPDTEPDVPNR